MTSPRATTVLTELPTQEGGAAPPEAATAAMPGTSICHAWEDQDIDTAGTEADLWFPRGDGSA